MDEAEIIRRLEQLAEIEPPIAATQQAINCTRLALNQPTPPLPRRRMQMIMRYSTLAASVLVLVVAGLYLFGPAGAGGVAFADVKDKIEQTKSVSMTMTYTDDDGTTRTDKSHALADGRVRVEDA